MENFFNEFREVIANETCRLVPKVNGKKLSPDSFELVKSSKHGQNIYAKIYTKASGKAKCKVSELVDESRKRVQIPLEELTDESFEGSCILKLYQAYVGSTKSISLSVEEILVTDRETSIPILTRINIYLMDKYLLIFILWINIYLFCWGEIFFAGKKSFFLLVRILFQKSFLFF